ncbi:tryptophan synthase beta subunit-like PLP-dependent enzyme [Syncephalis pseudoplumigaleata]|uniref:Tryptophan synthase n=1 Tax=Syncephalis pseudoplumigaleata TaxID=1712513 RepID=A0A4P9Z2Y9_9FUNG|nr:tryptophan synthase beta subunit-like PLP-dependent enzyme [Syncephalis pseudoplumigaleata]|eukprot:RKP26907.1 tryptophan synthase beta subunit-like PLP-dependent enzyme [Syncephalis pseudoplumigaleata]
MTILWLTSFSFSLFRVGRPAFVAFVTAGYPTLEETVDVLLALEKGGADIIELGQPFSDPMADGPTIQVSSDVALAQGTDAVQCLRLAREARARGLTVPILLMGYYNPIISYGESRFVKDSAEAGVNGFIVVDLPPEESHHFRKEIQAYNLSFVPLVAPSSTNERIRQLTSVADSFIYAVSKLGVTGQSTHVSSYLPDFIARVREHTNLPLAIGFGVTTREHFKQVGQLGDGVVIGSQLISVLQGAEPGQRSAAVEAYAANVCGLAERKAAWHRARPLSIIALQEDNKMTRFGEFGGRYIPEVLVSCHLELASAFENALKDPAFWEEFRSHYAYMGRESSLHRADRLSEFAGGASIWLKREDLNHTGSHKINNAIGQILIAKRLGKRRIIAETGAGQHGVATATVCAKFGLECIIYMGAEDVRRQALNVFRMRMLGATVVPVYSGSKTLKDAVNEAMRDWVTNVTTTHYLIGSAIGSDPFPRMVREFQSAIGREARAQILEKAGRLPDYLVACVGAGSNAIGLFHPFINDASVRMLGVEAAGEGIDTTHHAATLSAGTPGVFHGTRTYVLQNADGQIMPAHSISAGLDYPAVGPEHAWLKDSGRAQYTSATDAQALQGFKWMTELEGIIPALETSHAIYACVELARTLPKDQNIILCVSGRGDKDTNTVAEILPKLGPTIGWDLRFE